MKEKLGFLKGKTAIITGGGRAVLSDGSCGSIGYGIATAYAKEGANLVITGRNLQKLEDAKEELERLYGIQVLPVQADVNAGTDNEAAVFPFKNPIICTPFCSSIIGYPNYFFIFLFFFNFIFFILRIA